MRLNIGLYFLFHLIMHYEFSKNASNYAEALIN